MMNRTVACVYWSGEFRGRENIYTADWIYRLQNMLVRKMKGDYRFVCLTNVPDIFEGIETIPLVYGLPGWWSKLEAFRPGIGGGLFKGRVLMLDIDLLVMDDLSPLFEVPGDIVLSTTVGPFHKNVPRGCHSAGVMAFEAECNLVNSIWHTFINNKDKWMQEYRGDGRFLDKWEFEFERFPKNWITKLRYCPGRGTRPDKEAKIIHCMPHKNNIAVKKYPWIARIWK